MKRLFLIIGIFILISLKLFAQSGNEIDENSSLKERIFTGGNFGLSFGTVTYIEVSPTLGYRFTNKLSVGTGISYRYRKDKRFNPDLITNDYGGNVFVQYNVYAPFYVKVEYEFLSYETIFVRRELIRESYNSFLVGGGVSQPLGNNAALNFSVLYNLSYSTLTPGPYRSPWIIRGGVTFGF